MVTRILLIDNQSERFATQDVVSPYMLKLSRVNEDGFIRMQAVLYGSQDEWTGLSDGEVLAWLNRQSGQTWSAEELAAELDELEELEDEAPKSLPHVPTLYLNDNKIL